MVHYLHFFCPFFSFVYDNVHCIILNNQLYRIQVYIFFPDKYIEVCIGHFLPSFYLFELLSPSELHFVSHSGGINEVACKTYFFSFFVSHSGGINEVACKNIFLQLATNVTQS